jgi:PAS domain S-box-containing protein
MVVDFQNRILDMNPSAQRITGLQLNQSIGRPAAEVLSFLIASSGPLLELEKGQAKINIEKDNSGEGRDRYYSLSVSPVYGRHGDLKAKTFLIQDITSRKKAEIALRNSEETALALLNAPLDAAYLLDERGMILGARNLGKNVNDLKGTHAIDQLEPDVGKKRKDFIDEVFRSGQSIQFEDERRGRYFDNSILPIFNENGKVIRIAIVARDITDRKRAEQALQDKDFFLTGVAIAPKFFLLRRISSLLLIRLWSYYALLPK